MNVTSGQNTGYSQSGEDLVPGGTTKSVVSLPNISDLRPTEIISEKKLNFQLNYQQMATSCSSAATVSVKEEEDTKAFLSTPFHFSQGANSYMGCNAALRSTLYQQSPFVNPYRNYIEISSSFATANMKEPKVEGANESFQIDNSASHQHSNADAKMTSSNASGTSTTTDLAGASESKKVKNEKPPYSYVALIDMAIKSTPERRMRLCDIYAYVKHNFEYYNQVDSKEEEGWKNSIRHNLSLNDCFIKVPRDGHGSSQDKKGNFWAIASGFEDMFPDRNYKRRRRMRQRNTMSNAVWAHNSFPSQYWYTSPMSNHRIGTTDWATAAATGFASPYMMSQQQANYNSLVRSCNFGVNLTPSFTTPTPQASSMYSSLTYPGTTSLSDCSDNSSYSAYPQFLSFPGYPTSGYGQGLTTTAQQQLSETVPSTSDSVYSEGQKLASE